MGRGAGGVGRGGHARLFHPPAARASRREFARAAVVVIWHGGGTGRGVRARGRAPWACDGTGRIYRFAVAVELPFEMTCGFTCAVLLRGVRTVRGAHVPLGDGARALPSGRPGP